jgi:deoxyribodipyrimidine photo-lyase
MNDSSNLQDIVVFWFRRDLRLNDNVGLFQAFRSGYNVLPVFVFDSQILENLAPDDKRVAFIHHSILRLNDELKEMGASLCVLHTDPLNAFETLTQQFNIKTVYANHDYEPYAINRDALLAKILAEKGIDFKTFKDQVIFEKGEILKQTGDPYTVFTAYSRKWTEKYTELGINSYKQQQQNDWSAQFVKDQKFEIPSLLSLGFKETNISFPGRSIILQSVSTYDQTRDFPSLDATTHLSVHLRFGTVSIRELASVGYKLNRTWLNELQWREFFMQILWHFPRVTNSAFKPAYDNIVWRNNEEEFKKWCYGKTGYPIVDAGMRELLATGFMHNRVRMVTASFLVKHLLIDWRWGERWFAEHLLDYELSSNNGNWQWAAGCGCDAAPYFRIFNPVSQAAKFDPDSIYIKKWVPEVFTPDYPAPIVDHAYARQRCLQAYRQVKYII